MTPAAQSISEGYWRRWRDRNGAAAQLDDYEHCHWPEGCHPLPVPFDYASPDELELGIPAGTFVAIRRYWRSDLGKGQVPAMWAAP